AANKELAKAKKLNDDAAAALLKATHDNSKTAEDIRAATEAAKKAKDAFATAKTAHAEAVKPYRSADGDAKASRGYARMFQTPIAGIQTAMSCKQDLNCYAATLKLKPADAVRNVASYIRDIKSWTPDEQVGLVEASVDRAMLEL